MKSRLAALLSLLFLSATLFGQNTGYIKPNIYAVVVGISDYKDSNIPDLKFPEKDAVAFYNFLRSPNSGSIPEENIALLIGPNATRSNIFKEVMDKFSRSNKEDMIIFYFSGHGKAGFNETGYLLNYDADFENDLGTSISMPVLKSTIEGFKAKMKVSYLDACHAGLFASNGKGLNEDDNAVIARTFLEILSKTGDASIRFLASSAREQSLEDDQLGHGVFTYYLLKGLSGGADLSQPGSNTYDDGVVNISELNTYLFDSIPRRTKYKQKPSVEGKYYDQFPLSVLRSNVSLATVISKTQSLLETKPEPIKLEKNDPTNEVINGDRPGYYRGYGTPCETNTGTVKIVNNTNKNMVVIVSVQKVDLINNRMSAYEQTTVSANSNEVVPALSPGVYYVCLIDQNNTGFGDPVLQRKKVVVEKCKEATVRF